MVGHGNGWVCNAPRSAALTVTFLAVLLVASAGPPTTSIDNGDLGVAGNQWLHAGDVSHCMTVRQTAAEETSGPVGVLSRWNAMQIAHDEQCFFRALQQIDVPPAKAESHGALNLALPAAPELLASSADIPEIVVAAGVSPILPETVTEVPCGIRSIVELLAHPVSAWRELAPLPPASDTRGCVKATTIGDDVPEALGTMRWYE